jgi:alpha-tubulin suppressor-like RCC1 family protein
VFVDEHGSVSCLCVMYCYYKYVLYQVYTCGSNANGQLGVGKDVNEALTPMTISGNRSIANKKFVACAASTNYSVVWTSDCKLQSN